MYKPLQIRTPKLITEKPSTKRPSEYRPPRGLVLENCPQIQINQNKNGKLPFSYKLAQSILKHTFSSVHKPLRIKAPPKISPSNRAFEKYKPQGLFLEFYSN